MTRMSWCALAFAAAALACAPGNKQTSMRSPSYDYPAEGPWGTTTASGDSLGADKQSASDKLRTGPRVGSEGVKGPDYPVTQDEEEEELEEERYNE